MASGNQQQAPRAEATRRLYVAAGRTLLHGTLSKRVGDGRSVSTETRFGPGEEVPLTKADPDYARLVASGVLTENFEPSRPNTVAVDKDGPSISRNHEAALSEKPAGKIA